MNFLKKIQSASKSLKPSSSRTNPSEGVGGLIGGNASHDDPSDAEIISRKAEFLELLAKEERAHRVKLAELRNEPIQDRRSNNSPGDSADHTPDAELVPQIRTALPPVSPRFEEAPSIKTDEVLDNDPSFTTKISRPTEAETRADIGRQIGGTDFSVGGASSYKAPDFSAKLENDTPQVDVSAPEEPKRKAEAIAKAPEETIAKAPKKDMSRLKQKQSREQEDPYANMDFTRPIKGGRANVSELRLDVSRITSDIENGDALYRRAQQRVQGLMQFVERAEVDFSLLERIEPENRRLKARNAMISKEFEETVRQTALLESDLDEHRRRLAEINAQYDTVNGNLAKAMKALSERDHEIRQLTNDISAITLKLDREKTTTEVEIRENNVLRDRVVNLTNDLEDTKASRAEAIKIVESLKIDLEDHRNARERISDEAYDLRHALDEAQKQNNQMKGEMVALHQDISTFKTQYEFNIISRDDRIILLEAQIEDLARQILVKEDIVTSAARDVTELRKSRTGGELERERLEKIIDAQTLQLEIAQKQIMENQSAMDEMDTRYRDVAAALSITQNRRAHQSGVTSPDIYPDMQHEPDNAEALPTSIPVSKRRNMTDDYGTHEKDIIDDHITDYKLGLRGSMIPDDLRNRLEELSAKKDADLENAVAEAPSPHREDNFDALDQDTIEDRIMDYKLGLRNNIF